MMKGQVKMDALCEGRVRDLPEIYQPGIIKAAGNPFEAQYGNPTIYPLGPPTISTTTITVDLALNQPTRITRTLMDLTLQRFFADRVFTSSGGVSGGAVVYDVIVANDIYLNRDIALVSPGDEFPLVTSLRRAPSVAQVEKWGGKFFITNEARDRNDVAVFVRQTRQLANTIVRKMNQRAVDILTAAVNANSRTVVGNNWQTVVTTGASASNATLWPARDFARAALIADQEELGIVYTLFIMNPQEYFQLATIYGNALYQLINSLGLDIFVTNRVAAGTMFAVAEGQAGQMRIEQPLQTETWYEQETQRTWTQASVRPVMFIDNPHAILEFTGLAG
jgi:hypothetical protein